MGVELGKVLAKNILAQLEKPQNVTGHDSSVSIAVIFRCKLYFISAISDYWPYSLLPETPQGVTALKE